MIQIKFKSICKEQGAVGLEIGGGDVPRRRRGYTLGAGLHLCRGSETLNPGP